MHRTFCRLLYFDVIVIGGGHSGCEAAAASSRRGAKTLLVTKKWSDIGAMSCNPSFGGVGKGHIIREIDALGGLCGICCDNSGIGYKVLNKSRGPAVRGPRAQIDRSLYSSHIFRLLKKQANLKLMEADVDDILISDSNSCTGIKLSSGVMITANATVIATGTFLGGVIYTGLRSRSAGRIEDTSKHQSSLASTIKHHFVTGRLKTGSPPRLLSSSLALSKCVLVFNDAIPEPFSFISNKVWLRPEHQTPNYHTIINAEDCKDLVESTRDFNYHVKADLVFAPRYCPSVESKVERFNTSNFAVWLEPEGLCSELVYPNGLTCTMPEYAQERLVRMVPGLEAAEIVQYGYGVHYDFVDPRQLNTTLETKSISELFLAGQINGTTGYEEAAGQGLVAGANAAAIALNLKPLLVDRFSSYIGVMIDDITTVGVVEPYRMFTSRAELRLFLRPDNADNRLSKIGFDLGLVDSHRNQLHLDDEEVVDELKDFVTSYKEKGSYWKSVLPFLNIDSNRTLAIKQLLTIPGVEMSQLYSHFPPHLLKSLNNRPLLANRLMADALYESSLERQRKSIETMLTDSEVRLKTNINYSTLGRAVTPSTIEALKLAKPESLMAAKRIPGISTSALVQLMQLSR